MSKDVEFFTNFDTFDTFKEFKKAVRTQIIEEGLDVPLSLSAKELKTELQYIVNKKISMNKPEPIQSQNGPRQTTNDLNQPTVNIPKSEDELIKFLTNGKADPSKYNKAKDYTGLNETGMVFGHGSKGQGGANRVTLRMEIEPDETVESQYQKAKQFFSTALFALPDAGGNMQYFMNPGIDLAQFIKIKCSVLTGDGDQKTRKGLNPVQRFEKTKERGYADWTIKQEAVDVVRKNYVNITEVMNFLKEGDYDRAKQMVDTVDKGGILKTIKEQIEKLDTGLGLPATTQSYANAVKLVNNLKLVKKISQEEVIYTLMSDYSDFQSNEVDFYENIQKAIRGWVVDNEDYWFNSLVKRVEKLISQYESKE